MDLSQETPATHQLYGTNPGKKSFANNCLLARRLVERGVRFVQLYHRGWDTHGSSEDNDIKHALKRMCLDTDQAAAALIKDLKQRGLLDETIVIWGGEFGRTPMNEGRGGSPFPGRDHHPKAFSMWMAGGGIKPGASVGKTDDLGYSIVEDAVSVHDLHATLLHLLGMDHTKLTYKFQGRNFRLTDVSGVVVNKLLADSGFGTSVMFSYGYPGDVNEVPVTMGFYATRERCVAEELQRRCLEFLERFRDTRIRLQTIVWLTAGVPTSRRS